MHGNMLDMLHLQQLYGMLGNIGDLRFHGASPTARVASPAESLSTPPYALPAALQQPMYGVPGQSLTAHTPGLQHPGMHAGAHSQHGGQYANVTGTTPLQGAHFFSRPSSAHAAGGPLARHGSGHSAQMPPSLDPARAPLSVASARPEREQFNLDHAQAIADRAASNGASLTTADSVVHATTRSLILRTPEIGMHFGTIVADDGLVSCRQCKRLIAAADIDAKEAIVCTMSGCILMIVVDAKCANCNLDLKTQMVSGHLVRVGETRSDMPVFLDLETLVVMRFMRLESTQRVPVPFHDIVNLFKFAVDETLARYVLPSTISFLQRNANVFGPQATKNTALLLSRVPQRSKPGELPDAVRPTDIRDWHRWFSVAIHHIKETSDDVNVPPSTSGTYMFNTKYGVIIPRFAIAGKHEPKKRGRKPASART